MEISTGVKNTRYPIHPAMLVDILANAGYSPTQVSQMLGDRISFRALYRWRKREALPQRYSDYVDVLNLAQGLGLLTSPEPELADTGVMADGRDGEEEEEEEEKTYGDYRDNDEDEGYTGDEDEDCEGEE